MLRNELINGDAEGIREDCHELAFEAASKHTNPMLKSTVSPMRWLSIMQAYVLHCRTARDDVTTVTNASRVLSVFCAKTTAETA